MADENDDPEAASATFHGVVRARDRSVIDHSVESNTDEVEGKR